jgi:hypothetical protein
MNAKIFSGLKIIALVLQLLYLVVDPVYVNTHVISPHEELVAVRAGDAGAPRLLPLPHVLH